MEAEPQESPTATVADVIVLVGASVIVLELMVVEAVPMSPTRNMLEAFERVAEKTPRPERSAMVGL